MSIKLEYGAGTLDAVLKITSEAECTLHPYVGGEDFHKPFGGKQYYESLSGASGAGWVLKTPHVYKVITYRTDTHHPITPSINELEETLPGVSIIAPINFTNRGVDDDWPVMLVWKDGTIALTSVYNIQSALTGEEPDKVTTIRTQYIPEANTPYQLMEWEVKVYSGDVHRRARRVLEALYPVQFQSPLHHDGDEAEFYKPLGLWITEDDPSHLYKVTGGVARKRYLKEELARNAIALQWAAPSNVLVIDPMTYIQNNTQGLQVYAFREGKLLCKEVSLQAYINALQDKPEGVQKLLSSLSTRRNTTVCLRIAWLMQFKSPASEGSPIHAIILYQKNTRLYTGCF